MKKDKKIIKTVGFILSIALLLFLLVVIGNMYIASQPIPPPIPPKIAEGKTTDDGSYTQAPTGQEPEPLSSNYMLDVINSEIHPDSEPEFIGECIVFTKNTKLYAVYKRKGRPTSKIYRVDREKNVNLEVFHDPGGVGRGYVDEIADYALSMEQIERVIQDSQQNN